MTTPVECVILDIPDGLRLDLLGLVVEIGRIRIVADRSGLLGGLLASLTCSRSRRRRAGPTEASRRSAVASTAPDIAPLATATGWYVAAEVGPADERAHKRRRLARRRAVDNPAR